jgi:hypothetical protein
LIQLKSQYDLLPGTVTPLTIVVPEERLSLYGNAIPRLQSISTQNASRIYAAGDILLLDLNFSAPVLVYGAPTLTVNTGCYKKTCTIAERQSFVCRADKGQFGLTFLNQSIMNIEATTTMQAFKLLLQRLPGIHDVHVRYSEADSRDYSGGDRVCTSLGKNVTMTFLNVTFPEFNGDVPMLTFDITNGLFSPDLRTGLSLGNSLCLLLMSRGWVYVFYVGHIDKITKLFPML